MELPSLSGSSSIVGFLVPKRPFNFDEIGKFSKVFEPAVRGDLKTDLAPSVALKIPAPSPPLCVAKIPIFRKKRKKLKSKPEKSKLQLFWKFQNHTLSLATTLKNIC